MATASPQQLFCGLAHLLQSGLWEQPSVFTLKKKQQQRRKMCYFGGRRFEVDLPPCCPREDKKAFKLGKKLI